MISTQTNKQDRPFPPFGFVNDDQIAGLFGIHAGTVWKWTRQGKLPKPVKFSTRVTRWRAEEIMAHIEELATERGER